MSSCKHCIMYNVLYLSLVVQVFRAAALEGDSHAQCNLGLCYYFGKDVERNLIDASWWFQLSAYGGNAIAHCYLRHCNKLTNTSC